MRRITEKCLTQMINRVLEAGPANAKPIKISLRRAERLYKKWLRGPSRWCPRRKGETK